MTVIIAIEILVVLAATWVTWREPRRAANAPLIGLSVLVLIGSTALGTMQADPATIGLAFVLALSPVWLVALILVLLISGVKTMRREGRSLGNLLAGAAGLGLIGLLIGCFWLVDLGTVWSLALGAWFLLTAGWFGFLFVSMVGYQWLYSVIAARRRPDYLVALGAGLVDGKVGRLLGNRVRLAVRLAQGWARRGASPFLIMSGGQGDDEPRPEAAAMAEFASSELAVADDLILQESASTNTEENLRFTAELVAADPRLGPDAVGLAVTSNFHVLRTADLARRLGLRLQVAGAPVAWYYWPTAIMREFIAQLVNHKAAVVVSTLVLTLPVPLAIVLLG